MSTKRYQSQSLAGAAHPGRTSFDLSYSKIFDADFGNLYPVMCDEVVPGDIIKLRNSMIVRLQPLVAPILHEIYIETQYFFVPNRLMWSGWENFISGGPDGNDDSTQPTFCSENGLTPSSVPGTGVDFQSEMGVSPSQTSDSFSLGDFFGLPVDFRDSALPTPGTTPVDITAINDPLAYPWLAYHMIWAEYYRDENLEPVTFDSDNIFRSASNIGRKRSWRKDYFTSALPWAQRGTAPALPISDNSLTSTEGIVNTTMSNSQGAHGMMLQGLGTDRYHMYTDPATGNVKVQLVSGTAPTVAGSTTSGIGIWSINRSLGDTVVSLPGGNFNTNDLRLMVQVQKWQERNARAGVRYTEFLRSHFGVSPSDARLQRPEYIGGTRHPVIISEVLQTSETGTTTPQGNLAGHGIAVDDGHIGTYRVEEYGWIVGLLSIMPKPVYASQGVARQYTRRSRYDYYFPEFAHLGEEPIYQMELYAVGLTPDLAPAPQSDDTIFGFKGRYDELRVKQNMICGNMRNTYNYWHLGRLFFTSPVLGPDFLHVGDLVPDTDYRRIFAVPSENGFIINYANHITAIRPLPAVAIPGYADHF